jgi:hypothetical protein
VSVVEDLEKTREPLQQAAVYFITPTMASVKRLLADFEKKPLYPSVYIYFSSRFLGLGAGCWRWWWEQRGGEVEGWARLVPGQQQQQQQQQQQL